MLTRLSICLCLLFSYGIGIAQQTNPLASTKTVKVALVVINPQIPANGNQTFQESFNWGNPYTLTDETHLALEEASEGVVDFTVVESYESNELFTNNPDGSALTINELYTQINTMTSAEIEALNHSFDYDGFIETYDFCSKVDNDEIDEVWIYAMPFLGLWESNMTGEGAFWINGPTFNSDCVELLPVMGLNYERGVAEALHSFGHRSENVFREAFGSWNAFSCEGHDFQQFTGYDNICSGEAHVGNIHFPPNGTSDYDYDNPNTVTTYAYNWSDYPNVGNTTVQVNCSDWNCNQLGYMKWWYDKVPKFDCLNNDGDILNNWWHYIVDYNDAMSHVQDLQTNGCTTTGGGGCPNDISGFTTLGEWNNHKYYLSDDAAAWETASDMAEDNNGYLASINDADENEFIRSQLGNVMPFIGFNDAESEGNFAWNSGETVSYTNIDATNTAEKDYAHINFWAGTWKFDNAQTYRRFIVEVECGSTPPTCDLACNLSESPQGNIFYLQLVDGTAPYTLALDNIDDSDPATLSTENSETTSFTNLSSGNYVLTTTDADGCSCTNEFTVNNDPGNNCDVNWTTTNNSLTITGLSAPHVITKLFNPNWSTNMSCFDDCQDPMTISGLTTDATYHLSYKLYDANWQVFCEDLVDITISGSGGGGGNLPDLTVFGLNPEVNIAEPGDVVSFLFDLINAGTATAQGSFNVTAFISEDANFDSGDIAAGQIPTGNVGVGTIEDITGSITVPNLADGNYFLILVADPNNVIEESNDNNNLAIVGFEIDNEAPPTSCELIYNTTGSSIQITGQGLSSPHIISKVFNQNWQTVFTCLDNCGNPISLTGLDEGVYHLSTSLFNSSWQKTCDEVIDVVVGGGNNLVTNVSDLLIFNATKKNEYSAQLNWVIENELESDYFILERSDTGQEFETIETVIARNGNNYIFLDESPKGGTNFYKLTQVFKDGSTRESQLEVVSFEQKNNQAIQIFPNPTDAEFYINLNSFKNRRGVVKIYNLLGSEIKSLVLNEINESLIKINTTDWISGVYQVTVIIDEQNSFAEKLIITEK